MKLLSLLPKKDEVEFLLVYAGSGSVSAIRAVFTPERTFAFREKWDAFDPAVFLVRNPLLALRKPQVVVSVAPDLVHYAAIPVTWLRGHSLRPIEATEVENVFGQEISKQFNAAREEAARTLGAPEAHTILATSRVRDITVDGYRAADPIGLAVREVRAVADLAFIRRDLYETLKPLFTRLPVFFTDTARASLAALSKEHAAPLAILLPAGDYAVAHLLRKEGAAHVFERREFVWSDQELLHALIAGLGMGASDAESHYGAYIQKMHGKAEKAILEKKLASATRSFRAAVSRAKLAGDVFWAFRRPMPPLFPKKHRRAVFHAVNLPGLLDRLGMTVNAAEWPFSEHDLFLRFVPFADFYSDKGDSALNRWLKRRLHWLGAPQWQQ